MKKGLFAFVLPFGSTLLIVAAATPATKNWFAGFAGAGIVGLACLLLLEEIYGGDPRLSVLVTLVAALLGGLWLAVTIGAGL